MSVTIQNSVAEESLSTVPTRPDGTYFRFEMLANGGWVRVYADTSAELLDQLIDGYLEMGQDDRLRARIRHAADTQVRLQSQINTVFDTRDVTPSDWQVLVGDRHIQPTLEQWDCHVPLVIIDAAYAPYTQTSAPMSGTADVAFADNLWVLTPAAGEFEYLRSLHDYAVVELHMLKDEAI